MKKIAIVTGGSSGIGRAAALMLCENGYTVYEFSRRGENYSSIFHITADVTNPASIAAAAAKVIEKEGRIDLLVNNAGFGISGPVEFTDPADAHAQLEVNFYGAFNCIQAVLPQMRAQASGRIINLSSVAAPIAIPYQSFYSAAKAAINSLTLALRNEVRPFGIQVCAVQPGDIRTGFTAASHIYKSLDRAVAVMEHDEQNGMAPEAVAKVILKAANARKCRALYTVGAQYKLFTLINKLLPATTVNWLVGRIYR
mgnify:CR=1 FL=1